MKEDIWFRNPYGFLAFNNMSVFVPLPSMTYEAKLNTTLRFAVMLSVLLFVISGCKNLRVFYIVVFVAIGTYGLQLVRDKELREEFERRKRDGLRHDRRKNEECALPTKHNPFANILLTDYGSDRRKKGCDITKKKTKQMTESLFSNNLYKDIDDIWSKRTSSRMFYQTPIQTIPNDQSGFAQWLYGGNAKEQRRCKEGNGEQCMKNQM
jgi:hypothetical protein